MTLFGWLRIRQHDPVKKEIVEAIESEKTRLNGAVVKLSRVKDDLAEMLDDTLRALDRKRWPPQ